MEYCADRRENFVLETLYRWSLLMIIVLFIRALSAIQSSRELPSKEAFGRAIAQVSAAQSSRAK